MASQLTLALPVATRAEAERRGLDVDASIAERDRRMVGELGGKIASLNYSLEEAARAGFDVIVSVAHQDVDQGPRVAVVHGRIRRLAIDERI